MTARDPRTDVMHVITGTGVGGAEAMLERLCVHMQAEGWRNSVLSLGVEGPMAPRLRATGATVSSLGLARGRADPRALFELVNAVRRERPRLLQGWMYHGNLAATLAAAARADELPVAWTIRQCIDELHAERRLTQWVIRASARLSRRARAIVYNSELSRAQHEALGFAAGSALVIDNGFDLERWKPDRVAAAGHRAEWCATPDTVVFGCIARYHPVKNHAGLIEAFADAQRSFESMRLVLVGEGMDGANEALASLIRRLGVEGSVLLLGPSTDVKGMLAGFDVACLASHAEGFPNVVGEAMACGTPCIATDAGECARIIGDTGWVVGRRDVAALAEAMRKAARMEPALRRGMGVRARARIAENFAMAAVARRYMDLYERLAAGH